LASGGAQLSGWGDGADAIVQENVVVHRCAEVRGVQFAEVLLDDQQTQGDAAKEAKGPLEKGGWWRTYYQRARWSDAEQGYSVTGK